MFKDTINRIMDSKSGATVCNLYSRNAKSAKGSLESPKKDIEKALKFKYIKPLNEIISGDKFQNVFYAVTYPGAKVIGRKGEYENRKMKIDPDIEHESGVADLILSCQELWPDDPIYHKWFIPNGTKRLETDFMQNKICFEFERKTYPSQTIISKINKYESYDLPKGYKVAIVWAYKTYDVFMRHQEIDLLEAEDWEKHEENDKILENIQLNRLPIDIREKFKLQNSRSLVNKKKIYLESLRQFGTMIESVKNMDLRHDYYFTHFSNYHKLNQKIWLDKFGNLTKLR